LVFDPIVVSIMSENLLSVQGYLKQVLLRAVLKFFSTMHLICQTPQILEDLEVDEHYEMGSMRIQQGVKTTKKHYSN
jgi:hypothetical protein